MWEKRDNQSDAAEDSYAEYVEHIKTLAGAEGKREFQQEMISDFLTWVWRGDPIPDVLMSHVADTLDELLYGKGVVKVSDVLGPRPAGQQSRQKRELHFRVRQVFAKNKMAKKTYGENIYLTSQACGVSERKVEEIIAEHTKVQPFFKY